MVPHFKSCVCPLSSQTPLSGFLFPGYGWLRLSSYEVTEPRLEDKHEGRSAFSLLTGRSLQVASLQRCA